MSGKFDVIGQATFQTAENHILLQKDRNAVIGAGVTPLFPGFNDLYYSDTATCESRFQNGYFDESDKDPLAYMTLRNQVQLSTYGNSIGHNLKDMYRFVSDHLRGEFAIVVYTRLRERKVE